jgi:TPP-dependent 2-oxoacid decarboxylase
MIENFPQDEIRKMDKMYNAGNLLLNVVAGLFDSYYYSEQELESRKEMISILEQWWKKNDMERIFSQLKDEIQENEIPLINHDIVM